jgi:competence protein ComEA
MKKIFLLLALFSVNVLATPVNVNTADAQTIANSLNGIGEKKAQAIIAYREKNGDFKTVNSLTEVAGIGEKTVEKNREDILLTDNIEKEVKSDVKKPKIKEKNSN